MPAACGLRTHKREIGTDQQKCGASQISRTRRKKKQLLTMMNQTRWYGHQKQRQYTSHTYISIVDE